MSGANPGTIRFKEVATTPAAPPVGYAIFYVKTDNVVYLQDSNGVEIPLGTASGVTGVSGDVSGTGPGIAITTVNSVGGKTAAQIASAVTAALAATNVNTPSTIVLRDSSGNFSAGTITATLIGNASTATLAANTSNVGAKTQAEVVQSTSDTQAATASNTASTLVKRDASGNFSANVITASLSGNATTATTAGAFSGTFSGDVSGGQNTTSVDSVGGSSAANIHAAELAANSATASNTASKIVKRDSSGNFSAGTITADLTGSASNNVLKAGDTMSGPLDMGSNKITSTYTPVNPPDLTNKNYVDNLAVGIIPQTPVLDPDVISDFLSTPPVSPVTSTTYVVGPSPTGAWSSFTPGTLVYWNGSLWKDGLGRAIQVGDRLGIGFQHTGTFSGSFVGKAKQIATVTNATPGAFAYTFETPLYRWTVNINNSFSDSNGETYYFNGTVWVLFSAGFSIVPGNALSRTGNVLDVLVDGITVNTNGSNQLQVIDGSITDTKLASGINSNKIGTGTVSNTEFGYLDGVTSSIQSQLNAIAGSGVTSLTGDVSATGPGAAAATINSVGGSSAANIHSAELAANAATDANTASAIVKRDASGNFSAGTITATLSGTATNVSGTVLPAHGGTGLTTTPTNGQLPVGNGSGYTLAQLSQGAGITITNGAGSINVAMNAGDKAKLDNAVVNQLQTVSSSVFPSTVAGWGIESGTNYTVGATSRQVVVRENYAWDISFTSPGFIFCYDVTNPYSPVLLSSRSIVTTQTPPGNSGPRSLAVDSSGRYAYISMSTGQLNVFDYNDKSNPVFVGVNTAIEAQLRAGTLTLSPAPIGALFDVAINGNYLYATDSGNSGSNTGNGFYVIDITNPASPVQKWQVNLSGGAGRNRTTGIDTIGNYVYVAEFDNNTSTYNQSRLLIYDISNVATSLPSLVGSVALNLGGLGAVTVSPTGNYAYVSNRNNTLSFFVVNTTNKAAPSLQSTVNISAYGGAADVKSIVEGSNDRFIYVSSATTSSLLVYDVTTKTAPVKMLDFNTGSTSGVGAIALSRACLYVPNRTNLSMDIVNAFNYDEYFGTATGSQLTLAKSISVAGVDITKASGITNDSSITGATVKDALNTLSYGATAITALTGDVSATGPGSVAGTVNSVGGSTAANIHDAELLANAATNLNTASTIVKRDSSGNILITNVNGVVPETHASRHAPGGADALTAGTPVQIGTSNFIGASTTSWALSDHVHAHGNQTNGSLHATATTSTNGFLSSTDKLKLDTISGTAATNSQILVSNGTTFNPVSMSGDVAITNAGVTTVGSVGTSSASNIHSAELLANAATDLNTASTIVKRDASGNFRASNLNDGAGLSILDIANRILKDSSGNITLDYGTPDNSALTQSTVIGAFAKSVANNTAQFSIKNTSATAQASTDIIVGADTETDSNNFLDAGINSSVFSDATWTINGAGDAYVYNNDKALAIGTATANQPLVLFTGGTLAANERMRFTDSGASMNTSFKSKTISLTDGATIATDASQGNIFAVTIGGNRTLGTPTNPSARQRCTWIITQDATGNRTLAFSAAFNFGIDLSNLTLSTTANATDYIGAIYNSTTSKWDVISIVRGY